MKTGVVIVNTARGAVMDEDALVQALNDGKVFSCGLDVYENEPSVHPGLIAHPNVMLIPHMGTWTYEVCPHQKKNLFFFSMSFKVLIIDHMVRSRLLMMVDRLKRPWNSLVSKMFAVLLRLVTSSIPSPNRHTSHDKTVMTLFSSLPFPVSL